MTITKWIIDPLHSDVQFKVRHLVISTVTGSFNNFEGGATVQGDTFDNAEIHFSLDVRSIDTKVEARDNHLRSADFFDAENHPHINFQSTYFSKMHDEVYSLFGMLTIKGITKPVELQAEFGGFAEDEYGNRKAGFEVSGNISRWEFGLTYNPLSKTGGLVLGEEIKLVANIQLTQEVEQPVQQ
ncbi:YceI family protein [Pontibacter silvestris]|uniref:YceI family protein n=1 Tax=Pontibacter silvestris TaxID=2305183 RepID=A0ABW4WU96_9BACT|nr:YceI family protein [Pontibacter silvestris]MCC9137000.1 YceI family protein [Pontibacter silvestris]